MTCFLCCSSLPEEADRWFMGKGGMKTRGCRWGGGLPFSLWLRLFFWFPCLGLAVYLILHNYGIGVRQYVEDDNNMRWLFLGESNLRVTTRQMSRFMMIHSPLTCDFRRDRHEALSYMESRTLQRIKFVMKLCSCLKQPRDKLIISRGKGEYTLQPPDEIWIKLGHDGGLSWSVTESRLNKSINQMDIILVQEYAVASSWLADHPDIVRTGYTHSRIGVLLSVYCYQRAMCGNSSLCSGSKLVLGYGISRPAW